MIIKPDHIFDPIDSTLIFQILTQIFKFQIRFEPKFLGPIKFRVKVGLNQTRPNLVFKKKKKNTWLNATRRMHPCKHHGITHARITITHAHITHHEQNQLTKEPTKLISNPKSTQPTTNTIIINVNHATWICRAAATSRLLQSAAFSLVLSHLLQASN